VLHDSCAAIGRDPAEITCSMLARYEGDDDALRADVAAMESAGVDLMICRSPKSEPPAVIERVADAISG